MKSVAIIGAGAAGCFAAACLGDCARVDVYEAAPGPMKKLAITGGGRCNITNTFENVRSVEEVYPRGHRLMKRALKAFSPEKTLEWFREAGVKGFVTEPDGCVFPESQDAMEIVHCLRNKMRGCTLHCGRKAISAKPVDGGWAIGFADGGSAWADVLLVTCGGAPHGLPLLDGLDIPWVPTVPSLFTFTGKDPELRALMGLVVEASLSLGGFHSHGALLITDWGLSGPAVLRMSSYAARYLYDNGYIASLSINWTAQSQAVIQEELQSVLQSGNQKLLSSMSPFSLPQRLWKHIIKRAGIREDIRCAELGSKGLARLTATLASDIYKVEGRSRFRDEFVTAGGVDLSAIDPSTMQCRQHPGLYFAGEVLDIDAVTGGFNLQAAWSTGWLASQAIINN